MSTPSKKIVINPAEIQFTFIASPGPGGQNVNKTATKAQLRFNVLRSSSLPDDVRARLIALIGKKLTAEGVWIIKSSRFRTQERNKQDAISRLYHLIHRAETPPIKRKKTRPTLASKKRRLEGKRLQSTKKEARRLPSE